MQDKIQMLELRVVALEKVKDEFYEIKNAIVKMEMVDQNIYDKLDNMNDTMKSHKDNFIEHDKNEMEKYGSIEKRLQKLERVIYMAMGAGMLLQMLNSFHVFGG